MPKKDKKEDDKKAIERQEKIRREEEKRKQEETKKKYTEMTKEFKHLCTLILSKKSPKELEALKKEQINIVQQLQNEIDNFLKKRGEEAKTTDGAIGKTQDQHQLPEPSEPPPDYDCSSATTNKSTSDRQNGGKTWNADEVKSLEARYKEERDKLNWSLKDANNRREQYERERGEQNEKIKILEQKIKETEFSKKEKEKMLEKVRCEIDAQKREHDLVENALKSNLQSHQAQVKKLSLEKKEALTRLSELAGRKLLDNNPNIADLSTEIRPTKIGENFMQVYDNEWTDAFEELGQNGQDDKQCIDSLLKILKEAFEHTEIKAKNFDAKMISIISSCSVNQREDKTEENITKEETGLIRQLKKLSANRTKTSIQDEFVKERTWIKWQKSKIFAEKCVEMCWYMAIQTPPMALMFDMRHMHPFDEKYYKKYMTSGDRYDFLVWPCTLLHKDGPIVAKGIAEATTTDAAQTETPVPAANDTKQDKQNQVGAPASEHGRGYGREIKTAEESARDLKNGDRGDGKIKSPRLPKGDTSTSNSYPEQEGSVVKDSRENTSSGNGSKQNGSKGDFVTKLNCKSGTKL